MFACLTTHLPHTIHDKMVPIYIWAHAQAAYQTSIPSLYHRINVARRPFINGVRKNRKHDNKLLNRIQGFVFLKRW